MSRLGRKKERVYKITGSRLRELLTAELKYDALEAWGVDNWGGYSDALKDCANELIEEFELSENDYESSFDVFNEAAERVIEKRYNEAL